MATTFSQAWAKAQRGDNSGVTSYRVPRLRLTSLDWLQIKARADFRASQIRAFNGVLDKLET